MSEEKDLSVEQVRQRYRFTLKVGVFVAHPDDETIWAGGLLSVLYRPIVYACSIPKRDPIRVDKFFDACRSLDVEGRIIPHTETIGKPLEYLDEYTQILHNFGLIITHNVAGEYGHIHHKQIHQWVKDNANCPVLCFGYNHHKGYALPSACQWEKQSALECYNHRSPTDGGQTKAAALKRVYGERFNLFSESYHYAETS